MSPRAERNGNALDSLTSAEEKALWHIFRDKWANTTTKKIILLNFFIFCVIYTYLVYHAMYDLAPMTLNPECIVDRAHIWTKDINNFLAQHKHYRNALMILASLMMDIQILVMAVRSIVHCRAFRILICMLMFYGFRAFLQNIFFMRIPDDYLWEYPGFFSIAVEYFPKNDFFYSGHIGVSVITFLEFKRDKLSFMTGFSVAAIFLNFFVLLVTRSHYSLDLIMGMIMGHYCFLWSNWIDEYISKKLEKEKAEKKKVK